MLERELRAGREARTELEQQLAARTTELVRVEETAQTINAR